VCGILGIIGQRPGEPELDAALETLRHRGPDDRGVVADEHAWLGHRRLSIIDLGPGGHQPMVDPETGVVLIYNGEIYNYVELRAELQARGHVFRSSCDTEVLLRGYLEWGRECVEHFNGMWAFVVWHPRERRAFFARDRFGVKPLCYAMVDGALAIASEPKALLAALPRLRQVDASAIRDLLVERTEHRDERTFYAQVKSLPPGHRGTFRTGDSAPRLERYWTYPDPGSTSEPDALERFSELIRDAVRIRLRSDVAVGITISGGVDSTAILDAMAAINERVRSYTAVYPDRAAVDERRWARLAASRHPNVTLTEVPAPCERWLETLRKVTWHMDGPFRLKQVFPMWMIMERARADGVPVLLEGQGADEVFGGYAHHAALAVIDRIADGPRRGWPALPATARAGIRAGSASRVLKDVAIGGVGPLQSLSARRTSLCAVLRDDFLSTARHGARVHGPAHGRLERRLHRDFAHDTLPGLLRFGDAVSMAHSIEIRLPFLDYRLVEFGIRLPPSARVAAGETKRVLRQHLRGVGHHEIADRGDKKGFPTPAIDWLAADGGRILREVLLDRDARTSAIVDARALERAIARHAGGRHTAGEALYALLATELWWQQV
jgi:asparagine synthase (glutamine-hydrolysing)